MRSIRLYIAVINIAAVIAVTFGSACTQSEESTPTEAPTNTPTPTNTPMPTNTPTALPELSSVIAVDEILIGLQKFYLGGQLENDLDHAYQCVVWREDPTNRRTIDQLANLVQSYPRRYLPEPYSQLAKHFRDFSRDEIEFWCGGMKQNIEERLMARAWDFVRYRRNEGEHFYRADLGRWLNVATGMFDWANSERVQDLISRRSFWDMISPLPDNNVRMLDQTDGDPLTKTFGTGEFEFDVETWIRCVDFIDDATQSNLSATVAQMDKFLRYYYRGRYDELRFGGEVELNDVVMLYCASIKGRIERRMVANLLDMPVLSGY